MNEASETRSRTRDQRIPPYSNDAEQAVLGAMLIDQSAVSKAVELLIHSRRLYTVPHQKIFDAIVNMFEENKAVDIMTVAEVLSKRGDLEIIGGRAYLAELAAGVATAANVEHYARIVLEKSTLRELINTATQIVSDCFRGEQEVEDLLDEAEARIFDISENSLRSDFSQIKELIPKTFEAIEDYKDSRGGLVGYPCGFRDLDDLTAGMHQGDLIIIAGRPSMGKSALTLNMTENFCIETGKAAAFFSLEMSKEQLALRLLCGRARISSHKLRTGKMPESDWPKLTTAAGPLSEAKFYIDDTPAMSVLQMRAKARRLASQTDLGLVVIDYMQMMSGSRYAENRQQEISQISRGLKGLAKELKVPVVACSQLSRMVETRGGDKRPQLSDLRESGAIEQDADVVMFVYRQEYYLTNQEREDPRHADAIGKAEIILAKQRNGPTGTVTLSFLKDYARFENLAQAYRTPPQPSQPDESDEPPPF